MAEYRSVTVPLPEAQRLADLASIQTDFIRCKDMCELLMQFDPSLALGPVVRDALATAIPITYARPFNGGVRVRIESLTTSFDQGELVFHESILQMRSKYVAHSVNGMERQQVRIWINPDERGARRINNINIAQNHLASLSPSDYTRLSALCHKALAWFDAEQAAESVMLTGIVLQRHSIDSLYQLESAPAIISDGLDRAHLGRSRSTV